MSVARSIILRGLRRWSHGELTVELPGGETHRFGSVLGGTAGPRTGVGLTVHDEEFFRRLLIGGETGAGESYIRGEWECSDLPGLIELGIRNRPQLKRAAFLFWLGAIGDWLVHRLRANTRNGSKKNIREHYDLGNDFFSLFLDDTMTYSSGVFQGDGSTLCEAQREKYRRMAERAGILPGHHVLEIGCGWGGFAEFAARELGCRVTGVTISQEQARYARARIKRVGLENHVDILISDYRDLTGTFDSIVSIEMLEAVGHNFLGHFFEVCDRCLAPGGRTAIQVITIPDERYLRYRMRPDFIQKFVFPGAHLPSLGAMKRALRRHSSLSIAEVTDIAPHYARTLELWRSRLLDRANEVRALGYDDRFVRRWDFYFAYCQAGFAARYVGDHQLVLSRHGEVVDSTTMASLQAEMGRTA